jgi:Trk K+ transport system NAD-binding subunit
VLLVLAGTAGYSLIEGWSFSQSLYRTILASSLAMRSILDANLRPRFGVIVVGIQRRDLRMEFNPEPDMVIGGGDKLVVLGRPDSLKLLEMEAHAGSLA